MVKEAESCAGAPALACRLFVAAVALLSAATSVAAGAEVQWQSGSAELPSLDATELSAAIAELAARPDQRHVVVQFARPITLADREQSGLAGLNVLRYLGGHVFFASFSEGGVDVAALSAMPFLTGVHGIESSWKLAPAILAGDVPAWAVGAQDAAGPTMVGAYVLFHPDVPLFAEAIDSVQWHGAVVRDELESVNGLVVELPPSNITALADEDAVQWIEWPLPRMSPVNDSNRAITETDIVQAPPYGLDGSGVTVLVYDSGTARASHVDFQGRLTALDASGMRNHPTHVAGTIGGAGVADPTYTGMAPGVTLLSYGFEHDGSGIILYSNPGDIEDDYDEAVNIYGADVANNSIGSNVESNGFECELQGDYGVTAALIDSMITGSLGSPLTIVWASGNERQSNRCDVEGFGDFYSIAPPAGAKNHIAVGALNSNDDSMTVFSSWGPTDDGRIKPDLSAPGCQSDEDGGVTSCSSFNDTAYTTKCGTSMASPTVCGITALILQDFRSQFPSEPDPRNSTLKALLVHNAEDILNIGPDYKSGYGSVRSRRTIDFLREGNFREAQVDQDGTYSVLVSINPGENSLKATLSWDDFPGTPNVVQTLVNDLDLRVFDVSSQQYYPWTLDPNAPDSPAVRTRGDHVNNIEQVLVDNPAPGVWRVDVSGFSVPEGPQTFSLCVSAQVISCSSQGVVALDSSQYGCNDFAGVQVIDCDLNGNGTAVDTVTVTVASDTDLDGEIVLLTETSPDSADFRGTVQLDVADGAQVLQIADGDTITVIYVDSDDGQGGQNVAVTAAATVDCTGPVISNVQASDLDLTSATIIFETDEWAVGTVRYGLSCASLTESFTEPGLRVSHVLPLTGLSSDTPYFFAVDAQDGQGNQSTEDDGGQCFWFSTRNVLYDFAMDADPGWNTEGDWAFGQPTGGGSLYGDPTSGYTGTNVYGYNLDGDYANYLPATYLTTTVLDCSPCTETELRFYRWLAVEPSTYDHATVEVSNDGTNWTTVWEHTGGFLAESSWYLKSYDISAVADARPVLFVRWGMGPTNGIITLPGWNIDDVQIITSGREPSETCEDGVQNQSEDRIDCGGPCPPCECTTDGECTDNLFCNGAETCDAFGFCQSGVSIDCTDAVACTEDACNETTDSCDNIPNDAVCANGLYCDGVEMCDPVLDCVAGLPVDCSDEVNCTEDSCNETTDSCDNIPNDAVCDSGLYCDGVEICDPVLDCLAGTPVDCSDGVACTEDSCNETTDSCDNIPSNALCDNGVYCDGVETCHPVLDCVGGTPVDCDDSVDCTEDSCNEATDSCDNIPNDALCDNGLYCDGVETCDPATGCLSGSTPCPPEKRCRELDDRCVDCLEDVHCDDGDACNGLETCNADGTCVRVLTADCNENGTEDSCDIDASTSPDCNTNGIPDECDLENGTSQDANANGIPDECDPDPPAPEPGGPGCTIDDDCTDSWGNAPCVVGTCYVPKNRYLSVDPTTNMDPVAYRVTVVEAAKYPSAVGREWWVADPVCLDKFGAVCPGPDCTVDPVPGNCAGVDMFGWYSSLISAGGTPPVARLWVEIPVHIGDCGIAPVITYRIEATDTGGESFGPGLEIMTIRQPNRDWADLTGGLAPGGAGTWLPPNGAVNMTDLQAGILAFEEAASGFLPRPRADVDGNRIVNMVDVQWVMFAFEQNPGTALWSDMEVGDPADCP